MAFSNVQPSIQLLQPAQPEAEFRIQFDSSATYFFFPEGRSKPIFIPPALLDINLDADADSWAHDESWVVVSWSTKWVYFVRPERPKFLTYSKLLKALSLLWNEGLGSIIWQIETDAVLSNTFCRTATIFSTSSNIKKKKHAVWAISS